MNQNHITSINPSIGSLLNLRDLQLSHNQMSLPHLTFLIAQPRTAATHHVQHELDAAQVRGGGVLCAHVRRLSYNEFEDIPREWGSLVLLTELHVTHNKLLNSAPPSLTTQDHPPIHIGCINFPNRFSIFVKQLPLAAGSNRAERGCGAAALPSPA
jgi:hypothetical protein